MLIRSFFNIGHTKPRMKVSEAYLNGVMAYSGLAAVDFYIGAAQVAQDDPLNKIHPGEFKYGGGHVIQDLVAGKTSFSRPMVMEQIAIPAES